MLYRIEQLFPKSSRIPFCIRNNVEAMLKNKQWKKRSLQKCFNRFLILFVHLELSAEVIPRDVRDVIVEVSRVL